MKKSGLNVLTYNIHKGFSTGNRSFVLHQMKEALAEAGADLLFLQEMQGEHKGHAQVVENWPALSQFEFIAEGIWPYHIYGKNAVYKTGHHGNAILSRYPFVWWENINVSPFPWASRSLLHGVIQMPETNKEVHIVCIHLGLTNKERRTQLARLSERIDEHVPHHAPLIVAGDFNDWQSQAGRHFLEHLSLQEVFRVTHGGYARTFPSWMPILPMDRIYFRGLKPISCERLSGSPWRMLSDHAPLAASFSL
ncbi:MAG: endonuclease/exonuclease/phosphatase family protein [Gammaproteobacteria bacterium]